MSAIDKLCDLGKVARPFDASMAATEKQALDKFTFEKHLTWDAGQVEGCSYFPLQMRKCQLIVAR